MKDDVSSLQQKNTSAMKHTFSFAGIARPIQLMAIVAVTVLLASCEKSVATTDLRGDTEMLRRVPERGTMTITQIAVSNPNFSELVKALQHVDNNLGAGLVNLFNGTDQFTVFAPTNDAFAKLYATLKVGGIAEVDPNTVLAVLKYHVTGGRRASNSVLPTQGVKTIETLLTGATFSVDKMLKITAVGNTANIVAADVSASNGIIHVLDNVILPIKL
jgi:transforming growth factor-beta-induced protein